MTTKQKLRFAGMTWSQKKRYLLRRCLLAKRQLRRWQILLADLLTDDERDRQFLEQCRVGGSGLGEDLDNAGLVIAPGGWLRAS